MNPAVAKLGVPHCMQTRANPNSVFASARSIDAIATILRQQPVFEQDLPVAPVSPEQLVHGDPAPNPHCQHQTEEPSATLYCSNSYRYREEGCRDATRH